MLKNSGFLIVTLLSCFCSAKHEAYFSNANVSISQGTELKKFTPVPEATPCPDVPADAVLTHFSSSMCKSGNNPCKISSKEGHVQMQIGFHTNSTLFFISRTNYEFRVVLVEDKKNPEQIANLVDGPVDDSDTDYVALVDIDVQRAFGDGEGSEDFRFILGNVENKLNVLVCVEAPFQLGLA